MNNPRISQETIFRVDFDLWGFRFKWVEVIIDKMYEFAGEHDVHCESSTCEANMSVWIETSDTAMIDKAIKVFNQYAALAKKSANVQAYVGY